MNNIVGVRRGPFGNDRRKESNSRYLEIIFPSAGDEIEICRGGEIIRLGGGEIALIPALLPHSLCGGSQDSLALDFEQPLLPLKQVKIIKEVANGGMRHAAEQAAAFFDEYGAACVINALGELIISYAGIRCGSAGKSPVVAMIREDIENGARDSLYSVEAFMKKLPLSYDYVRKLFKKETGLTPHEYLTAVRMERAEKIILSGMSNRYSQFTVGQIAEACGYAEPLYFSRVFKKYFGVSPTEYAKNKNLTER